MPKRAYSMTTRARRQAETRARIVDATVELHREVGPAATTISAVAERASVQRLTVYRHFPDDRALLEACAHRVTTQRPPPDPEAWMRVEEPAARLATALREIYGFYGGDPEMLGKVLRDARTMPVLAEIMQPMETYLGQVRDMLAAAWSPETSERRLLEAHLEHALAFSTWSSLRSAGMTDDEAAAAMARFVGSAFGTAEPEPPSDGRTAKAPRS